MDTIIATNETLASLASRQATRQRPTAPAPCGLPIFLPDRTRDECASFRFEQVYTSTWRLRTQPPANLHWGVYAARSDAMAQNTQLLMRDGRAGRLLFRGRVVTWHAERPRPGEVAQIYLPIDQHSKL